MHEPGRNTLFTEAFERIVHALPHQPEFRNVEVVAHSARPGRFETQLTVTVDREGGVDVATCERIAARINASLDAFTDPYTLEVGSAGLNRPLTKDADYDRFAGRPARIVTADAIAGAKTHRGILSGVRGASVILKQGPTELSIPLAQIRIANLEYDIRADLQRAKHDKSKKMHSKPHSKHKNTGKKFRDQPMAQRSLRDPSGNATPAATERERNSGGPAPKGAGGAEPGAERL